MTHGASSPEFESVHPEEEGNQEIAAIGSPTKSIKLFRKLCPGRKASASERDIMRAGGRRIVVSTAGSEGPGPTVDRVSAVRLLLG
jgi:hypothetical protein